MAVYAAARAQAAIAAIESGGNYNAVGPRTGGDRAYGKYQMMGDNIPAWTNQVLGYAMTPDQFLADPQSQDAVFNGIFGGYVEKYGAADAASLWFTGRPASSGATAKDVLGTTGSSYVKQFLRHYTGTGRIPNAIGGPDDRTLAAGGKSGGQSGSAPSWVRPGDVFRKANFDPVAGGSKIDYAISADGQHTYFKNSSGQIITIQRDGPPPAPSTIQRPTAVSATKLAPTPTIAATNAAPATATPALTIAQQAVAEMTKLAGQKSPYQVGGLFTAILSGDKTKIDAATKDVTMAWDAAPGTKWFTAGSELAAYAPVLAQSAPHAFELLKTDAGIRAQIPAAYSGMVDSAINSVKDFKPPTEVVVAAPIKGKGDPVVADAQGLLTDFGFHVGGVDGIMGPRTAAQLDAATRAGTFTNPDQRTKLAAAAAVRDEKLAAAYATDKMSPFPSSGGTASFGTTIAATAQPQGGGHYATSNTMSSTPSSGAGHYTSPTVSAPTQMRQQSSSTPSSGAGHYTSSTKPSTILSSYVGGIGSR